MQKYYVNYFDYMSNCEHIDLVCANNESEAKLISYCNSCYVDREFNPEDFTCRELTDKSIGIGNAIQHLSDCSIEDPVGKINTLVDIINKYNKENDIGEIVSKL